MREGRRGREWEKEHLLFGGVAVRRRDVREERHFDHLAIHMINQLQLFRTIISAIETLVDKVKQVKFSEDLKKEISEFDAKFMNLKAQWLKEAENLEWDIGVFSS